MPPQRVDLYDHPGGTVTRVVWECSYSHAIADPQYPTPEQADACEASHEEPPEALPRPRARQAGEVTWVASVDLNNGSDLWAAQVATAERDTREGAAAFVELVLGGLTNPPADPPLRPHYHAHLWRGTYTQRNRRSPIVWEPDDTAAHPDAEAWAWLGDDGTIGWDGP